jgi:glutathione peroxidase
MSIYEIPVKTIDGTETNLSEYKGKTLLIVNVAGKCGLTPQYEGLQALYAANKDKDFVVLGFPANNFLGQEPGTDDEIKEFCSTTYSVTFPMFSKISAKGDDQHPLYKYLTETAETADISNGDAFEEKLKGFGQTRDKANDILWNFEKFLIGKNGEIISRIAPDVKPDDERVSAKLTAETGS